jgi:hypothetical protein
MNAPFSLILYEISIWAIPAVIAITFHEASHGYVAHVLGDDTAWRLGRVSFNPLVHIDPFGTVVLPVILPLLRAPLSGTHCDCPANRRKNDTGRYSTGRKAMEWFSRKTSIAGVQISNWMIVLGAVIVILLIYNSMH